MAVKFFKKPKTTPKELIFGKDDTSHIVSIEVDGDSMTIFRETSRGITTEVRDNVYWLVNPDAPDMRFEELEGDLYYKHIKTYTHRGVWMNDRRNFPMSWSVWDDKEAAMIYNGLTYYKGMKVDEVSVLSFDIEAYGLLEHSHKETYIISNTFRSRTGEIIKKQFSEDEYEDEGAMIEAWCDWVREVDPSILTGWNIYGYDLPYLKACAKKYGLTLDLGRDGSEATFKGGRPSTFRVDGSQEWEYQDCTIYGREIIDGMFLAVRYDIGRNFPNWKLKDIMEYLDMIKEGRQFYDATTIKDNWHDPEERKKIKQYCVDDGDDALAFFDLAIPAYFYLAPSIPKRFCHMINKASGSQINSFLVRAYLQDGHSLPRGDDKKDFEGAISDGNPGIYKNVRKWDVASLYPSIIRHYNIYDEKKDPKKYMLEMVEYFTLQRLENKKTANETGKKYYRDMEQAQKIVINSIFGFMGANKLLFNSPDNAALVTEKGREILTKGIEWAKNKGFQIVNVDTDSFSVTDNGRELGDEENLTLIEDLNSLFPELIVWEDDGYYKSVVVVKTKNYALLEYGKDKVKIKGSALKATTKEPALKEMIKRFIDSFLGITEETIPDIYHEYVKEAYNIKDIHRWGSKKSVSEAILKSSRTNEVKLRQAIKGEGLQLGDKFYVYFDENENHVLTKYFDGCYHKDRMLEKVFKTAAGFEPVYDVKANLLNFKLKRNKKALDKLVGNVVVRKGE